jgi:hypothetical protein
MMQWGNGMPQDVQQKGDAMTVRYELWFKGRENGVFLYLPDLKLLEEYEQWLKNKYKAEDTAFGATVKYPDAVRGAGVNFEQLESMSVAKE